MDICLYDMLNGNPPENGIWLFVSGTTSSNPTPPSIYNECINFTSYDKGEYLFTYITNNPHQVYNITICYEACCNDSENSLIITGCTSNIDTIKIFDSEISAVGSTQFINEVPIPTPITSAVYIPLEHFVIELLPEGEITVEAFNKMISNSEVFYLKSCLNGDECCITTTITLDYYSDIFEPNYSIELCSSIDNTTNLFDIADVPIIARDGLWTALTSGINSNNFNTINGILTPDLPPLLYTFRYDYLGNSICKPFSFIIDVNIIGAFNLKSTSITVCRDRIIDLTNQLATYNNMSLPIGTWSNYTNTGCNPILEGSFNFDTGEFNTSLNQVGVYCFTYNVESNDDNCESTSTTLTVNVEDCTKSNNTDVSGTCEDLSGVAEHYDLCFGSSYTLDINLFENDMLLEYLSKINGVDTFIGDIIDINEFIKIGVISRSEIRVRVKSDTPKGYYIFSYEGCYNSNSKICLDTPSSLEECNTFCEVDPCDINRCCVVSTFSISIIDC